MQTGLVVVFGIVAAVFLALMVRLAFLSGEDKYEKSALAQQSYVSSVIPYKRGSILDRNGNVLAASDLIYHLILDPKVLLTKEENVNNHVALSNKLKKEIRRCIKQFISQINDSDEGRSSLFD